MDNTLIYTYGNYYGIGVSIIFILFLIAVSISVYKNKTNVKLYTIMLNENGKVSKVAIAFLMIMPVIIYQAIYLNRIAEGLDMILLTIFATELGSKFTDKLPDIIDRKKDKKERREEIYNKNDYE